MLLTLEDAQLAFGHVALLDGAALQIDDGEKIALIGRNGSGKSSLLRALAGLATLDHGSIWRRAGLRLGYVAQEPDFPATASVFETLSAGLGAASELLLAYHGTAQAVAQHGSAELMQRLQSLQEQLDHADAWNVFFRVEQTLSRLGLRGETRLSALSGGGIKRVALGRALVADPDLLLLDEPTNHLDLDGILWLEQLLRDFRGGVLLITHDRSFLDAVATRVVELDRGKLASFPGSFTAFAQRKEAELAAEQQQAAKFDKFLAQEEVWIRKGIEARRTRNEGRVRRLEALRLDRAARRDRLGQVQLRISRGEASGKMVAELEDVSKRYDQAWVLDNFSCRILRGDKIGLIGPNGAGKTTLLKLILGELAPDKGTVRLGSRLEVAYFDQFRTALDEEAVLVDVISPGAEYVEIGGQRKHVISYLGDFLFAPERARSPVKSLSGGERNRLLLARLFAKPANVLVLDEPTNDLDIETLELLEGLLQEYAGTLFLVSHDRRFLDNVVTQTVVAEGGGLWREYAGGYEDWLAARQRAPQESAAAAPKPAAARAQPAKAAKPKLSYRQAQELAALPPRIEALEAEQAAISARLSDAALYREAPADSRRLQERLRELETEVAAAMARWEELERLA